MVGDQSSQTDIPRDILKPISRFQQNLKVIFNGGQTRKGWMDYDIITLISDLVHMQCIWNFYPSTDFLACSFSRIFRSLGKPSKDELHWFPLHFSTGLCNYIWQRAKNRKYGWWRAIVCVHATAIRYKIYCTVKLHVLTFI